METRTLRSFNMTKNYIVQVRESVVYKDDDGEVTRMVDNFRRTVRVDKIEDTDHAELVAFRDTVTVPVEETAEI